MSDNGSEAGDKEEGPIIGVYEGERNAQKQRHGRGKNTFPNGDVYEGEYVNGKRCGKGTYTWKAGHQYTGDFYSNTRQGEGLFYYPDGSKYNGKFALKQGSFVAGKREGHGVYLYPNGDVYQGEWQGDLKHGFGTYIYSNGSKKKGVWVKGSLSGAGEIIHADHKITGIFFNDKDMKMPVQLTFPSSGYSKTITNPSLVGMQPSPVY